jgi:hypothetical protein
MAIFREEDENDNRFKPPLLSSQRAEDSKHFSVKVLNLMKGLVVISPTYVSMN